MATKTVKRGLPAVHPGELLREGIVPAQGKSKVELARLLGISRQSLYNILDEKQPVGVAMALLLGKLIGNGLAFWLNLQQTYDLEQRRGQPPRWRAALSDPVKRVVVTLMAAIVCSVAEAQTADEWKVTLQLVSGNATTCVIGGRSRIKVVGAAMSYHWEGVSYARWTIQLAGDGSADVQTQLVDRQSVLARVKVPPGAGPRAIDLATTTGCRYKLIPDKLP